MLFYKIVNIYPKIGSVIDTFDSIDYAKINRISKLSTLFDLLFEISHDNNESMSKILSLVYPSPLFLNLDLNYNLDFYSKIELIKEESSKVGFVLWKEFRYFNDHILEKIRHEISKETGQNLPNRFESNYFFESIENCQIYCDILKIKGCKIIEVDFIEKVNFYKMDNKLVSEFGDDFTSTDFYNQAKKFLMYGNSDKPLHEIIFQGKYKVLNYSL